MYEWYNEITSSTNIKWYRDKNDGRKWTLDQISTMEWEPEIHGARIRFGFAAKVDFGRIRFITLTCSCLLKINIEDDSIMLNDIKEVKQILKK